MPITGTILVGLLCLWLGHRLTIGRDAAIRRRAFREYIASLDDEFNLEWKNAKIMDSDDFDHWAMLASHDHSIPKVMAEAAKVREDIFWWKRPKFKAVCVAYAKFGSESNSESNHEKFERVRKDSEKLLNTLIKCAR
jgi:hypothetical protein